VWKPAFLGGYQDAQSVSLINLAPDMREALLFLPPTLRGRDAIILADVQLIAATFDWRKQGGNS
jgi:hypothetical protein